MNKIVKIFYIVIVFLLGNILVYSQAVTWQRWYDYNNLENSGQNVIQTFDGGYLVLINNYLTNFSSVLMKTDEFGNIEWQKLYDQNNLNGATITSFELTQYKDSGFVLSGTTPHSPILIRVDKAGEIVWFKNFTKPGFVSGTFYDHTISSDGGIIACGNLFEPLTGYVVKTDSNGNIEWDSLYIKDYTVDKIIESSDGFLYMLELGVDVIPKFTKANYIGRIIWRKTISDNMEDLVEYSSKYLFIGAGHDSLILSKVDTSGTILFQKSYYHGVLGCEGICISSNRDILMTGTIKNINSFNIAVSKIDSVGNLIFNKSISSVMGGNFAFLPRAVNSTNDSGFIFTGFTDYPMLNPFRSNTIIVKTDSICVAPLIVNISISNSIVLEKFILYQNYPNPFNPTTIINYLLSGNGFVSLKIYDVLGKEVMTLVNEKQNAGSYSFTFDGSNLANGIYFYKLEAGSFISTKRMVLLK